MRTEIIDQVSNLDRFQKFQILGRKNIERQSEKTKKSKGKVGEKSGNFVSKIWQTP